MLTPNDHPLPTRPDSLLTSALYKSFTYLFTYLALINGMTIYRNG